MPQVAKMMGLQVDNIITDRKKKKKIGRLEWLGKMDNWDFTVYRYSREIYDPEAWFFPGSEDLDGTVEGALNAGFAIYP